MNTYKKLFKYLHPFVIDLYPLMGVGVGAHVLGQVLSLAILPIFYQRIVDSLVPEMQGSLLVYQEAYLAVGLFVLITVVYRAGDYLNAKIQSRLMARLNKVVFHKFINRDYHFYLNNFSGSLVAKFSKFSSAVVNVYDILNYHILGTVVGLLAVFIVLSQYSWLLVGIFALWTVLYLAISIFWSKKRAHTSLLKTQSFSRLTGRLSDTLSNIGQVKSFGKESFEEDHFGDENGNWSNLTLRDWNTYVHGLTATSLFNFLWMEKITINLFYTKHETICFVFFLITLSL